MGNKPLFYGTKYIKLISGESENDIMLYPLEQDITPSSIFGHQLCRLYITQPPEKIKYH